jgi:multimeric flavodoxin WrbA
MVMRSKKPDILFISGSPRAHTCVALIDLLERGAKNAGAKTQRFLLSKKRIDPCIGCGRCNKTGICALAGKAQGGRFTDDYLELKAVLERVDAIAIVAPLYFAGPPAQLKALFDRMQPYWAQRYLLGQPAPEKRPAQLFVVGGGGDAHGYAPLSTITKSSLAIAGFNLEKVNNFIGFSAPAGVPAFPSDAEVARYTHAQLAHLKRAIAQQQGFVQRAIDAGGAFARFVVKKRQANDLAEQLAQVEAELEDLKKVGDATKSEPLAKEPSAGSVGKPSGPFDHKGELHAEIALEYSNLLSRTPREVAEMQRQSAEPDATPNAAPDAAPPATSPVAPDETA